MRGLAGLNEEGHYHEDLGGLCTISNPWLDRGDRGL